ncbi:MAG: hypothetical protein JWP87_3993, partial [Labilithrix sp.]|nr:hypothetical protein [Labilithrix sp.]
GEIAGAAVDVRIGRDDVRGRRVRVAATTYPACTRSRKLWNVTGLPFGTPAMR